jgi:hypothetical protein
MRNISKAIKPYRRITEKTDLNFWRLPDGSENFGNERRIVKVNFFNRYREVKP